MSVFKWTPKKEKAVIALSSGHTQAEAAEQAGVTDRTVRRWESEIEFQLEKDRLTHMLGVSTRAERLRIAMRVVRGRTENTQYPISKADLLDWMKFIQSETDGVKLDMSTIFANAAQMADSRPD